MAERTTQKRDYYDVLGVPRSASSDDLRKAYRTLAREYHPDVNSNDGAEDRFKEINEAYEVLSDSNRRAQYDRFGHAASGASGSGDPFGFGASTFGDIFETFFGGSTSGRRRSSVIKGQDLQVTIDLDFEEAVFGAEKEVEITRLENCEGCNGTRMKDGKDAPQCETCGGSGEVRRVQQTILGQFMTSAACSSCNGEGVRITDPCPRCRGKGRVTHARRISVSVPPGIDESATLRLSGQGEASPNNGPAGNLFVKARVKPHAYFTRQGKTIQLQVGVNIAQAILGDEIELQTMDGPVAFKLPQATQSGQQFRLKNKGVPDMRGGDRGDQIVTIHVIIPRELTSEQRSLVEQLGDTLGSDLQPQPTHRGFFDKVKDALGV
ncbi:molecular chaperone DnaJ [soil metagenome]